MKLLTGIQLRYETLAPVENPEETHLSVGTVTFSIPEELCLDFNLTLGSYQEKSDNLLTITASLEEFEPSTFQSDYAKMGITASDLTYDFFASRLADTYVLEVYTEYYTFNGTEKFHPLTLQEIQLLFSDGSTLDYSDRISISAQAQLAEVA